MLRTVEMDCRPDSLAPRQAREFVAASMNASGLAELVDRAELLTSEVVTNAIAHANNPVHLVVEARSSSVVIEVKDVSQSQSQAPAAQEGDDVAEADRGRGMVLVEALSDRWGWWEEEGGMVVWFALLAA